jgi:hypothetical protein
MKKIIFTIATGIFALATIFNMNMAKSSIVEDISLESIAVMAQANGESSGSGRWQYVSASGTTSRTEGNTTIYYHASGGFEYHTGTGEIKNDTSRWVETYRVTTN